MQKNYYRIVITIALSMSSGLSFSQQSKFPDQILGKSVEVLKNDKALNIKGALAPAGDDDALVVAWGYVESNGHGFTLYDKNKDGIIDLLSSSDEFFMTEKIQIGDSLEKVMSSYQDADFHFSMSGLSAVWVGSKKILYVIGTHKAPVNRELREYSVENKILAKSKVIEINIFHEIFVDDWRAIEYY